MRINLTVPAADAAKVKQYGARYDDELKVWYVHQDSDPRQFMDWIPAHQHTSKNIVDALAKWTRPSRRR